MYIERNQLADDVNAQLTIREMEYLEKIRSMDMTMYGEVLRELTRFKPDIQIIKKFQTTDGEIMLLPSAPLGQHNV